MLELYKNCYYDTCRMAIRHEGMMKVHEINYGKKGEKQMTEKLDLEFFVAGVKFRKDWRKNIEVLEEGEILLLAPEPTNKFDKDAVQIASTARTMLGYVPAKTGEAKIVAKALRKGKTLKATLTELSPDFEPWTALQVRIEEVIYEQGVPPNGTPEEII